MKRKLRNNLLQLLEGIERIQNYCDIQGKVVIDFKEKLESSDYLYLENKGWYQDGDKIIFEFE